VRQKHPAVGTGDVWFAIYIIIVTIAVNILTSSQDGVTNHSLNIYRISISTYV